MVIAAAFITAVVLVGCSGREGDVAGRAGETTTSGEGGLFPSSGRVAEDQLSTLVVGYEVVAGTDQRVLVGLLSGAGSDLVGFGEVVMAFYFLGSQDEPLPDRRAGPVVTARFIPVPGSEPPAGIDEPRVVAPSAVRGVYGSDPVRLDEPGFWAVEVTAVIDGETRRAPATPFRVLERSLVPAPGDPAPRTVNAVLGDPEVVAGALDSRAVSTGEVPDPLLHSTTVADVLAAGRPALVLVSTPTYCQSRFCGPITESVEDLAEVHGEEMAFVHLEVWRDFEAQEINAAAAEWIAPEGVDEVSEPWIFLVGRDGTILQRWDNVVSDAELRAAVERVNG